MISEDNISFGEMLFDNFLLYGLLSVIPVAWAVVYVGEKLLQLSEAESAFCAIGLVILWIYGIMVICTMIVPLFRENHCIPKQNIGREGREKLENG